MRLNLLFVLSALLVAVTVIVWLCTKPVRTIIGSLPRQDLIQVQKLARQDLKRQALLARSPRAFGRWLTARTTSIRVYSSELVEVQLTCYSGKHTYLLHKHEGADGWHVVKGRWLILGNSTAIAYPNPSLLPSSSSDTCPLYSLSPFGQPGSGAIVVSKTFLGQAPGVTIRVGSGGVGTFKVGSSGAAVRLTSPPSGMVSNSHSGIFNDHQAGPTNLAPPAVFAPYAGFSDHANLRY